MTTGFSLADVWWRAFNFIRRATYSLPAGRRHIIRVLSGIQRAIYNLPSGRRDTICVLVVIARAIYRLRAWGRNIIPILSGDRRGYRLPCGRRDISRIVSGIYSLPSGLRNPIRVLSRLGRAIYRFPAWGRNSPFAF